MFHHERKKKKERKRQTKQKQRSLSKTRAFFHEGAPWGRTCVSLPCFIWDFSHVRRVCSDVSDAGWWESHWPCSRSWSGTDALQGVGLIRLCVLLWYPAQSFCRTRPIETPWNMCCLALRALSSRKRPRAFITIVAHVIPDRRPRLTQAEPEGPLGLFGPVSFCVSCWETSNRAKTFGPVPPATFTVRKTTCC